MRDSPALDLKPGVTKLVSVHDEGVHHGSSSLPRTKIGRSDGESEIRSELAALGIDYERWSLDRVGADASAEDVLTAYASEIEEMKRRGGYVTADVIDVNAATPNLDAMLAKFDKEHTHSEDEVRFILAGRGIFFLNIGARSRRWRWAGRHAARAAGNDALVHAVRGSADSRDPVVPANLGMDAAIHRFGRGQELSAVVLRSGVSGTARGDRHPRMSAEISPKACSLLDVEGTIAPMSLVYEQLFPYARAHFERYLQNARGRAGRGERFDCYWRRRARARQTRMRRGLRIRSIGMRRFRI